MSSRLNFAERTDLKVSINSPLSPRDPEDRWVASDDDKAVREKMLDKTLADSYPASDPPSTLPNPSEDSVGLIACKGLPGARAA